MTDHPERFAKLVARLSQFDQRQLEAVEAAMDRIECVGIWADGKRRKTKKEEKESDAEPSHSKDWPRAPLHRLEGKGAYIVTGGTLNKCITFVTKNRSITWRPSC